MHLTHPNAPGHVVDVADETSAQPYLTQGWIVAGDSDTTSDETVLKGEAPEQALRDAGLLLTGTAAEKRARLAEHQLDTTENKE